MKSVKDEAQATLVDARRMDHLQRRGLQATSASKSQRSFPNSSVTNSPSHYEQMATFIVAEAYLLTI